MAQPKYAARFENFFLNLRLNRAQFADMAAFTLQALQANAAHKPLADALDAALAGYRTAHVGQLSGEAHGVVITVGQALADFKEYVKRVERKAINPAYEPGSADLAAILPKGRSGLTKASQGKVEDAFRAFLDALDARPTVFTSPIRTEGRQVLKALSETLQQADTQTKTTDDQRLDLHDGREAACLALFRAYATLLLEFAEQPQRVAAFFDLSKAGRVKAGPKIPSSAKP